MLHKIVNLVLILGLFVLNGTAQNSYTLGNRNIEFSIDCQGNLVSLKNIRTGQEYAIGKPIWRLYFDRSGRKEIQVLAKDNQPEIKQSGNEIFVVYNDLKIKDEIVKFGLSLRMVLEENLVRFYIRNKQQRAAHHHP